MTLVQNLKTGPDKFFAPAQNKVSLCTKPDRVLKLNWALIDNADELNVDSGIFFMQVFGLDNMIVVWVFCSFNLLWFKRTERDSD